MTPFLKQVAEAYVSRERLALADYCFIFPNKRSGVFFHRYLQEQAGTEPLILPQITTMANFIGSFSEFQLASRLDSVFTLYNEYRRLAGAEEIDFDRFLFWGEMLIADFNDVDRYLADPDRLFVNVKRYREVAADYLTDEQKEILSRYWGESFQPSDPDTFWRHVKKDDPATPEGKFQKLWEILGPLYKNFRTALAARGLATEGMMIRRAVEALRGGDTGPLRCKRYIFVGLNVLTVSEVNIMSRLQALGLADFYWDMASPALRASDNRAVRFMERNISLFPPLYDIEASHPLPVDKYPEIIVTGVPSAFGQAKEAGRVLQQWVDDKTIPNPADAIGTAVVLPDESLFIPMNHSVPESITELNITMGFPLRATPFASFINAVVRLQTTASLSGGEWRFFYRDAVALLSHPLVAKIDAEGSVKMLNLINQKRLYMIPAALFASEAPALTEIFTPVEGDGTPGNVAVYTYFYNLLNRLGEAIEALSVPASASDDSVKETVNVDDVEEESEPFKADSLDLYFIKAYLMALDELRAAIGNYGVAMTDATFIRLLQRAISSAQVNFAGEPLKGLQIMGVLETRSLDFDNIIMLSMNEKVFPRKSFSRSFIPDNLRRAYGLATSDFQESIYAYYFYRLIARASKVRIFYDVREGGVGSSEVTRYVAQLAYLYPECRVSHEVAVYPTFTGSAKGIVIEKSPEIMEAIRDFERPGGRTLSASSLKTLIRCPLAFYLGRIAKLNLDEDVIDYMDASTYGTILHAVAENIYKDFRGDADEVKVTEQMLRSLLQSPARIDRYITRAINKYFNNLADADCNRELTGEALVTGRVMRRFIESMLEKEIELTPFDFIAGEYPLSRPLAIGHHTVNINQIIDRVDRVYDGGRYGSAEAARLRVVDYKTGGDHISFGAPDSLFMRGKAARPAIFQVMFYCTALASEKGYDGPIQPVIYPLRKIRTEGLPPIRMNRKPLLDYREIKEEFGGLFGKVIDDLFNPDIPFTQTPDKDDCEYCAFRTMCRRN